MLLLSLTAVFSLEINATHVVGGEIYYRYLGNDTYEITLKVYRDCGPTNSKGTYFDEVAQIGIFETATGNEYDDEFNMLLESADVDFVPIVLENPCFILPPDVCVQRAIYTNTIELPFNTGGYTLVYQRCCRNPSIVNLDNPQSQGATFTTHVPGTAEVELQNSSARFNNFPPVALCMNAEFYFDHGATDDDGDSLVYEFCSPMLGGTPSNPAPDPEAPPFTGLDYANGFSSGYPITSNPAFAIDPATGFITGTATELGQFVIGVCVSEYRNGELINSSNRDFQFNVTMCDPNIISSIPDQDDFCNGSTITFENNSTNASFFFWDFGVDDIESDTSSENTPTYTYTEAGQYSVMLVANPTWPCADTSYSSFTVWPLIEPEIVVQDYDCVNGNDFYDFSLNSNATNDATYEWNFGTGSIPMTSTEPNPQAIMMNPEALQMNVTLIVTDHGCLGNDDHTVPNPPDPVSGIIPQSAFCDGFEYSFENDAENADEYFWDFGAPGMGDISTNANPTYTFQDPGSYNVMLVVSAPNTCSDTAYMNFEVFGVLDPNYPEQDIQCLDVNSYDFFASGASTTTASYHWDFGENAQPQISNQQNPQNVSFTSADVHVVTLTITENGCTENYTDSLQVVDHFLANLSVNNAHGCPGLVADLNATAISDVPVYYIWDFGDGNSSQQGLTTHTYEYPGIYDVTVTAFTLQGCVDSLTQVFPGAVVVHPDPIPGFSITPQIVDIMDPATAIADSSMGSIGCHYLMSDGGLYEGCDFTYEWTESGFQTITQYVENEWGCTANVTGTVIINGFVFYAPNSFSPNMDGHNDFWKPEMTGISKYELQIYNRWGEMIYTTDNPDLPWFGNTTNGDHFVQDGVYQFIVLAEDLIGLPHDFKGHITLIR